MTVAGTPSQVIVGSKGSGGSVAPSPAGPAAGAGPLWSGGGSRFGSQSLFTLGGVTMRLPPGGFAAFGQESPATQALFGRYIRANGGKKRRAASGTRKRRKKKAAAAPRKRRRTSSGGARLKKGSPAAKRRMAQLRKMRKR